MEYIVDEDWENGHFNMFTEHECFKDYIETQQRAGRKISLVRVNKHTIVFSVAE